MRGLDIGSQMERVNRFCVTGFPDVHLEYIINNLNGTLDADDNNPESVTNLGCSTLVQVLYCVMETLISDSLVYK